MIILAGWSVLVFLVGVVWITRHLEISRAHRELPPLTAAADPAPLADPPFVSVLIAAKDEEENIEVAVRSMLDQDYPNYELIVINDRSDDRTGEILDNLRAERADDKLKVVHIQELAEGWFGKNNAMREGVKRAGGQWFCFGDADCRQTSRQSLSTAVRFALDRKVDFLSVFPQLEMQSIWEQIIQPVCSAVMIFWFHPRKVNDPKLPNAYANGAFMLMTRSCYEAIGRHEAVRTEVNEDMHMARIAKEKGQRLFVIQGDGLYKVRMYTQFKQIWRGWSRIFYGCFGTFRRLRVTLIMLTVMNLFPYASLLAALIMTGVYGWSGLGLGWRLVVGAGIWTVINQLAVIARFYRLSRVNPVWAPTWIVGAVVCSGMLISAMLKLRGRMVTTWRGTTYRGAEVVQRT